MNPILWWTLCVVIMAVMASLLVSTWVLWKILTSLIYVLRVDEGMSDGQVFQFMMDLLNFKERRKKDPNHTLKC